MSAARCPVCAGPITYRVCRACDGWGGALDDDRLRWDWERDALCVVCDGAGETRHCAVCERAERIRRHAAQPMLPGLRGATG